MNKRYNKRLEDEDLWEVYDMKTGRTVIMCGFPLDGLGEHAAEEYVRLLEAGELVPDASDGS
ncbi:hypothetical protein [Chelativorans salis]|uniref:Uncharacterized protein n=1 Tax=Chelativorans salis TaxID=2978478 RepID=A0ABT2LR16_9HYPH|nr:hypothetical protein [Chelativorans sp. EGI FJ00035]MCT7376986.1 hypothetical protein [Chelativorans sp. EGI FJ00035]